MNAKQVRNRLPKYKMRERGREREITGGEKKGKMGNS